jgi:hypothetical protein
MATPGKDTAPFLQDNPATKSSGKPAHPPYDDKPQDMGSSSDDHNSNQAHRGPDRPQPSRSPDAGAGDNTQSVPAGSVMGGRLPYPGPSKPTATPFKGLK